MGLRLMDYPVAVLDASVLFSASLRDILMRLAGRRIYAPRWTEMIHREWIEAVLKRRPDITRERLERTKHLMDQFVLDAIVTDFENLIPNLQLPDPNDRHVLAAAIIGQADTIVTHNLKDFPSETLSSYNIQAQHPDDFIYRLLQEETDEVLITMRDHRLILKNPAKSQEEYLLTLEKQGLTRTAGFVKEFKYLI